jgi:phage shock protein B
MEEEIMGMAMGALAIVTLFIGLPWVIMHYVTRWKTAATLTSGDEALLEELHDLARRLDERMCTLERIMTAENPNWRAIACDPASTGIEDRTVTNQTNMRVGR